MNSELSWNRRQFIQSGMWLVGGWLLPSSFLRKKPLTILHTNDFHSRFEAFPQNHPLYPKRGGIVNLASHIACEKTSKYLLLDCGDIIQGTPYFNFYKGFPEIEWMNKMGYHAATIGNHDFDLGVAHLNLLMHKATFPFVSCNYSWSSSINNPSSQLKKFTAFNIQNIKIGITGIGINPKGLIPDHLFKGMEYAENGVTLLQEIINELKEKEKCDAVIVLSHLGLSYKNSQLSDTLLAHQTYGIDAILGGHTHTFLEKPLILKNAKNKKVIVNQAGWAGLTLGKVKLWP